MGNNRLKVYPSDMISVGSKTVPGTRGIFVLIYMDEPNKNKYTRNDLITYKEFLQHTSAHRFQNNPDLQMKVNRGVKYNEIIEPLFDNIVRKEIPPTTPTTRSVPPPPQTPQLHMKPFQPPSYSEIVLQQHIP